MNHGDVNQLTTELARVKAERDDAMRLAIKRYHELTDLMNERDEAVAALAVVAADALSAHGQVETARAVAFEEAARQREEEDDHVAAAAIRALAPLPESRVCVERETWEKVKAALKEANETACAQNCDEEDPITHVLECRRARAALALLEAVKP